jgi:hypothetical protein
MNRRAVGIGLGCVLVTLIVLAALQLRRSWSSSPPQAPVDRRPDAPAPPVLQAAPRESSPPAPMRATPHTPPTPSPAPEPGAVAQGIAEPVPEPVRMPTAGGVAVFDDGRPVADASVRVTSPSDRMVLAVGVTDSGGRFALTVPGLGDGDYWFDDHGLRFQVQAPLRESVKVVVPTFSLRVKVEPVTETAIVTLVAPDQMPASIRMDGVEPPPPPTLEYADDIDKRFGGRRLPVTGDVNLRLPVVGALVMWASSADGTRTSNVVEVRDPTSQAQPIVLSLSPTVSMNALVIFEGSSPGKSFQVSTFGLRVPAQVHTLAPAGGTIRGLLSGQRYRVRSESDDLDVVAPNEFVAEAGATIEIRARELVTTRVEVSDSSGAPVKGARVWIFVPLDDPASRIGRASRVGGVTDEKGVWEGRSVPWTRAQGVIAPPPGDVFGVWEGEVLPGGTYKITLDKGVPFTTLRVRPSDCVVRIARKDFSWLLPGTATIPLPADAFIEVTSGGRYVRKRLRALDLPPTTADVQLEKAARFVVVAPSTVTSLRFFQGGGKMFIDEAFTMGMGPGRFAVTGFASGTAVGVIGRCGNPARPCTERVDFTVREGATIELKEGGVDGGGQSRTPK